MFLVVRCMKTDSEKHFELPSLRGFDLKVGPRRVGGGTDGRTDRQWMGGRNGWRVDTRIDGSIDGQMPLCSYGLHSYGLHIYGLPAYAPDHPAVM